jgi:predicted nucleic acid-binding protein
MELKRAQQSAAKPFLHLAGVINGPPDLSTRKGFEKVNAIADTGLLVASANHRDTHHRWAVEITKQVSEPLLTCDGVLAEAAFHLGNADLVLSFVRAGLVTPAFSLADQLSRLADLATRYPERSPDLADLCLIRMRGIHAKHSVITTAIKDFSVCRRGRLEAIPLICPIIAH